MSEVDGSVGRDLPAVCISGVSWGFMRQRPQHLIFRYAQHAPVLFVEPPSSPGYSVIFSYARSKASKIQRNLWSLRPKKMLPRDRTSHFLKAFNDRFTRNLIDKTVYRLNMGEHLLWCYRYDSLAYGRTAKSKIVLYDCVDDWASFWKSVKGVAEIESKLVVSSDIVLTTANRLYESKKKQNPHTYLVPNGVEYDHFSKASKTLDVPPSMERIPHPIIGFTGAVYEWVDLDLVAAIAKRRPEWSFVFVGPVPSRMRIPDLPNVRFLGEVPYDVLPSYLSNFDACILPFRHNEITENANPIKMYEYLATGKPIVSTGIAEVIKFSNLIYIAEGVDEFEEHIEIALKEGENRSEARRAAAAGNSWDQRMLSILGIIRERRDELGV